MRKEPLMTAVPAIIEHVASGIVLFEGQGARQAFINSNTAAMYVLPRRLSCSVGTTVAPVKHRMRSRGALATCKQPAMSPIWSPQGAARPRRGVALPKP